MFAGLPLLEHELTVDKSVETVAAQPKPERPERLRLLEQKQQLAPVQLDKLRPERPESQRLSGLQQSWPSSPFELACLAGWCFVS